MRIPAIVWMLLLGPVAAVPAASVKWDVDANMDRQLFPSLLIATATQRPSEGETAPDPQLLGDPFGSVGASMTVPKAGSKVEVTVLENAVMNRSSWSGVLPKAGTEYYVAPPVNFKFEKLRKVHQQLPLNVTIRVVLNGKPLGEKTETLTLRTINECPFAVSDAEETIDEKSNQKKKSPEPARKQETKRTSDQPPSDGGSLGQILTEHSEDKPTAETGDNPGSSDPAEQAADGNNGGYTDMGWMFAAYVNENSPVVESILKEALATKIVDSFAGYQKEPDEVIKEVFAIWAALQKRGIKYSNITTTAAQSQTVYSQYVRFVDQSVANEQANCVDGSVVFASILRRLGLRTFLVTVPEHMFMGVYLTPDGDSRIALETTLIGTKEEEEAKALKVMDQLPGIRAKLDKKVAQSVAWKTFATALAVGTQNLQNDDAKFSAEDEPQYQIVDVDEARQDGIMPISYEKAD